jgi:hypothetical protein
MNFDAHFSEWLRQARAKAADGLTFSELLGLVLDGTKRAIQLAAFQLIPGPEKKELVKQVVHRLYGEFLANVPIPYVPAFLQAWLHRQIAKAIDPLIDAGIEWLYLLLKRESLLTLP